MQLLIAHLGRFITWLLLTVILASIAILLVRQLPIDRPDTGPISPGEALAQGGHTVTVRAVCEDTGEPLEGGIYEVITLDGRPPAMTEGELADNTVQFVVGPDWIGQVEIYQWRGIWTGDFDEVSELIGKPYGWHPRTVPGYCPDAGSD